jgi:uncharacterized Zn finger protein (UPF0148 family)
MQAHGCECPYCGAPLDVSKDGAVVLCLYCRGTCRLVVDPARPDTPLSIEKREVPKESADEIIRMVLDGKRQEAVALYASVAQVEPKDAQEAVNALVTSLVFKLTRHLPIAWLAVPIQLVILAAMAAGGVWAGQRAARGTIALGLLAVVLLALFFFGLRSLFRHTWSRLVAGFGPKGRAKVLRTSIIRREYRKGGTLLVVQWEVRPSDGSAPFRDDETMLVRNESVAKLDPGNVVSVRFDRKRSLVFPSSPIVVLGRE